MSEIRIEPKPRRSALPYLLGLLLVAAIAVAVWFLMERNGAPDVGDAEAAPMTAPITAPPPTTADTGRI